MPALPTLSDLAKSGMARFQITQAVFELATGALDHERTKPAAIQTVGDLAWLHMEAGNEHVRHAAKLTLVNLLYISWATIKVPPQTRDAAHAFATASSKAASGLLGDGRKDLSALARKLVDSAIASPNMPDFVRAVGYEKFDRATTDAAAEAAAYLLQAALRRHAGEDPTQRWVLLGDITNTLAAGQYLGKL